MAAPAQRRAIEGERQYFTFRLTRRTVPMTFSMMFVAGERTPQFRRQSELCYGEHLVEPFQDRGGNTLPVAFETSGEIAKELFGLVGVVHLPGLPQEAPHLRVHRFRQAIHDVAGLVYLTTLNGRVASKRRPDRLGKSLRAVDDEEARHGGIEAALDEIIDQRLHGRRVFC